MPTKVTAHISGCVGVRWRAEGARTAEDSDLASSAIAEERPALRGRGSARGKGVLCPEWHRHGGEARGDAEGEVSDTESARRGHHLCKRSLWDAGARGRSNEVKGSERLGR